MSSFNCSMMAQRLYTREVGNHLIMVYRNKKKNLMKPFLLRDGPEKRKLTYYATTTDL